MPLRAHSDHLPISKTLTLPQLPNPFYRAVQQIPRSRDWDGDLFGAIIQLATALSMGL